MSGARLLVTGAAGFIAGPFGQGAPAPRFAFAAAEIGAARRMGDSHLRFTLSDGLGGELDAVAFQAMEGPLGPLIEARRGMRLHLAGRVEINRWGGRATPQLRLEDAAPT